MRLSFQRFFGLPRLRTPCGRLSLAIFARRLSSILSTWASHSRLRTSVHLIMSWIPPRWRRWSLRILSLSVFPCIALIVFISVVRGIFIKYNISNRMLKHMLEITALKSDKLYTRRKTYQFFFFLRFLYRNCEYWAPDTRSSLEVSVWIALCPLYFKYPPQIILKFHRSWKTSRSRRSEIILSPKCVRQATY